MSVTVLFVKELFRLLAENDSVGQSDVLGVELAAGGVTTEHTEYVSSFYADLNLDLVFIPLLPLPPFSLSQILTLTSTPLISVKLV